MKNINILPIKPNFPHLKENKKSYLFLSKKSKKINPGMSNIAKSTIYPHSLLLNPYNNNAQSIRLMKSNPTLLFLEKKKYLNPSSSDFYITRLPPNQSSKNIKGKKNLRLNSFKTQNNKTNNLRYKSSYISKRKLKKEKDKEDEDIPKLRYLGNIIRFKKKKQNLKKDIKTGIIPIEQRKDYFEFINKRRKIIFNPKDTSQYVHDKSSDYLIYSIKKTKSYQLLQPEYTIKPKNQKEEIIEMRDKVPNMAFKTQKLIKQIRNLFSQDFKFNYTQFNEDFYDKFENKINFIDDIYRVPIFKNNLVKIILNKNEPYGYEEWKNINVINSTTWNHLNRVKRKLQREKDEKLKREKELELKKKQEEDLDYMKKKKEEKKEKKTEDEHGEEESNNSDEEDDNNKRIIKQEENYYNIMKNVEKEEQIKQGKYEDLYIIEEYFIHKNNCNSTVSIASDRLRYIYFNKHDFE